MSLLKGDCVKELQTQMSHCHY